MGAHSELGGSVIKRLGHCPGARRASRGMPNESTRAAAEGTVAHAFGEAVVGLYARRSAEGIYGRHLFAEVDAEIARWIGRSVEQDGFMFEVDAIMARHVRGYLDAVRSVGGGGTEIEVEQRFDLSAVHEGMFGTSDCTVYLAAQRKLFVIDLKYGEGVEVDAEDNEQLMFYALGALLKKPRQVSEIEVCIYQPRSRMGNPFRRWAFPAIEILDFMARLKEIALATEAERPSFEAGAWCQFCPAAPLCPTLTSYCDEVMYFIEKLMTHKTPDYDPKHMEALLRKLPIVKARWKAFEAFCAIEKRAGRGPSDHKFAASNGRRNWTNPAQAAQMLQLSFGLKPEILYEAPSLKSPAAVEEELKNQGFKMDAQTRSLIGTLVTSSQGGLSLVPSESGREEVTVVPVDSHFTSVAVAH